MVPSAAFQNVNYDKKFYEGKIEKIVDNFANTWVGTKILSNEKQEQNRDYWTTYQAPHPPQPPITL